MIIELPISYHKLNEMHCGYNRQNREFKINNGKSIKSITKEIHKRKDIDSHELIRFNLSDEHGIHNNPILTMESDYVGVTLSKREEIALKVGERLNKSYHCQVQVVWSGNKSHHIHFRINRRNMVDAEAKAIQKYLTDAMEVWVRKKYKIKEFTFDRKITNRLGLVRLGDGTRIQTGNKPVKIKQNIIRYWGSDFNDLETVFPMNNKIKEAIKTSTVNKAKSRARSKGATLVPPTDKELLLYGEFIKSHGSTVIPSHWGYKTNENGNKVPVVICYYSKKDPNPSCVLGVADYFTTDSRGNKHHVGFSFNDHKGASHNDLRGVVNGKH